MKLSNVKNEADIDGNFARQLRLSLKLSQGKFWSAIGVSQSAGCRFENERNDSMSEPIRILLFMRYVIGLEIDAFTPRGVRELRELAAFQRGDRTKNQPATV